MEYSFLGDLDNSRDDWKIRVRASRIWESINTRNGNLISMDMLLIDEKENVMHATIRKNLVRKFKPSLLEGGLFSLKNIKIVENLGEYRPASAKNKIIFLVLTTIEELEEGSVKIPMYGFEFIGPELVSSRVNDNTYLSDVVGCLCAIGDVEAVGAGRKKRDIKIITESMGTTRITLWGALGENFNEALYKKNDGPFIVILTATSVKIFQGEIYFSTTTASKLYVNIKTDFVGALMKRFSTRSSIVDSIGNANANRMAPAEEMALNRMTIKQLLDADWENDVSELIVTVRAIITGIDNAFGWHYVSCNVCSKKAVAEDGVYMCNTCKKECKFPLVRYKVHLTVQDKTGASCFVLFNSVAEKLLDTSAHKLFNRQSSQASDIPMQIEAICGKEYIFKLRLNHYNLVEGLENFTVVKIFQPDEKVGNVSKDKNTIKEIGNELTASHENVEHQIIHDIHNKRKRVEPEDESGNKGEVSTNP